MTSPTKPELIDIAKSKGIEKVDRDGKLVSLDRARKSDIQNAIDTQNHTANEEKVESEKLTVENSEKDFPETEQKIEEIKTYVRDYIQELVDYEINEDIDSLLELSMKKVPNIITRIIDISENNNVHTISNNKSKIFSSLEKEYSSLDSKYQKLFKKHFDRIRNSVYNSETMMKFKAEKRQHGKDAIKQRKGNKTNIKVSKCIDWAIKTLENLDKYSPQYWKPVTQALKVLTGRRSSEILSSAKFIESDYEGCVYFSGQNKKHKKELNEKEKPYIIPIIKGRTDLVIAGLDWLNNSGKRILPENDTWMAQLAANTKVNKNLGRYLSEFCKGADGFHLNFYDLIESDKDWSNQAKPDCTRDIYTQILGCYRYEQVKDIDNTLDFLIECLGHGGDKSIVNYNVDFIVSYEEIKDYFDNVDLSFFKYGTK